MTVDSDYLGPSVELIEAFGKADQAPSFGHDPRAAGLRDRVIAAGTWDQLAPADQAFIREMHAEVDAGLSPTWQGYTGDWPAEDAALDADDELPIGEEVKSLPVDDDAVDDDGLELDEVEAGDEGWIGL